MVVMKHNQLLMLIGLALCCYMKSTNALYLDRLDEYLYDHVKSEDAESNLRAAQDLLNDSSPIKTIFRKSFQSELVTFVDLIKVLNSDKCDETSQNIIDQNQEAIIFEQFLSKNEQEWSGELRRIDKIVSSVRAKYKSRC